MSFLTNCIKYMINTRILNYEAIMLVVSKLHDCKSLGKFYAERIQFSTNLLIISLIQISKNITKYHTIKKHKRKL